MISNKRIKNHFAVVAFWHKQMVVDEEKRNEMRSKIEETIQCLESDLPRLREMPLVAGEGVTISTYELGKIELQAINREEEEPWIPNPESVKYFSLESE